MKLKLPLFAAALAVALAIPSSRADDDTPPPPPPSGEHGPEHKGGHHGDRFKFLCEKLSLTDDQKAKAKPIFEDEMKAMKAIREDSSLDRKAKWAKMEEIHKTHREQFRALLTPEQQKKLDELKEERGPRSGGPGPGPEGEGH